MKKQHYTLYVILLFIFCMVLSYFIHPLEDALGNNVWVLFGVLVGIASSLIAKLITKKAYKDNPELARQAKINQNDERYITIRHKAGYYMWFITLFCLCAMSLAFVVMDLFIPTVISLVVMFIHAIGFFAFGLKISKNI